MYENLYDDADIFINGSTYSIIIILSFPMHFSHKLFVHETIHRYI